MTIQIIATGGTFDKKYNELTGELVFDESRLPEILRHARLSVPYELETLMLMDSLDMTDEHREEIAQACMASPHSRILITHGTDTMAQTALYLKEKQLNKTIVLTGAMRPYSFGSSDGIFNLGTSIAYLQCKEPGVYISMNGKCFQAGNVHKNRERGRFEAIKLHDHHRSTSQCTLPSSESLPS